MRKYGLQPLLKDKRDFSHRRSFGAPTTSLPVEFKINPLRITNQYDSQFCTAFSSSSIGENQWSQLFSPEWTAAKEGQLNGKSIAGQGTDLRTAMKAGQKYGFLPSSLAPFTIENESEGFLGDWNNWDTRLDTEASKFKEDGYYAVDGYGDTYTNIKNALWIAEQDPKDNQRCVEVGSKWYQEWEQIDKSGIIPDKYENLISLHAHKIIGWRVINGVEYLIDQQSQGNQYGDNGLCYFSRAVVNKEFTEGLFMFRKNVDPNQIKQISVIIDLISKLVSLYQKVVSNFLNK